MSALIDDCSHAQSTNCGRDLNSKMLIDYLLSRINFMVHWESNSAEERPQLVQNVSVMINVVYLIPYRFIRTPSEIWNGYNFINSYFSTSNGWKRKRKKECTVTTNWNRANYEAVIKHPILTYFRLWVVRKRNENQKQHLNQSQETINNSDKMVIHSPGLQNPLFPSPAAWCFLYGRVPSLSIRDHTLMLRRHFLK